MVHLQSYLQFKKLLDSAAQVEDKLFPNELEMLDNLVKKYTEAVTPDPVDIAAAEVLLRNVEIRKNFDISTETHEKRKIDLGKMKKRE